MGWSVFICLYRTALAFQTFTVKWTSENTGLAEEGAEGAGMFDTASIEEQKMVASYLINTVTLTQDYGIQIEFNVSEAQYLGEMGMR